MLSSILIRPARISDRDNLSALSCHTWLDTYAKDGVRSSYSAYLQSNLAPDNFEAMIKDRSQLIWVAENERSLIGYIALATQSECPQDNNLTTEVTKLYIFRRFANCGIGSQLLLKAIDESRQQGRQFLWLSTNHENEIAVKFYKKHGFSIIGTLMFELEDGAHPNHILMKEI